MIASFVRNILTKNYQNLIIGFQVTVKNVGDAFLGHSVVCNSLNVHSVKLIDKISVCMKCNDAASSASSN